MRWFVPFWLAGMSLFYVRSVSSWIGTQRLRRAGVSAAPPFWQARARDLAARLGILGSFMLFESCMVDVPVVAGFWRPVILLPAGLLTGIPVEQLEYLLLHELAHIRRFDYAVNLLQKAIEGMLFYHPAVWWVSGVIRLEREHCCDDIVLSNGAPARSYAATLAALETRRLETVMAANSGSLTTRIRRILNVPVAAHRSGAPLLSAVLLAFALCGALIMFQPAAPLSAQLLNQQPGASTSWEKWLNEDVAYIIQAQERNAFLQLQTDDERATFVQQFWERRNPTSGIPANPFKEEHYRRIASANKRYTVADLQGWQSDRGRIYITFGPPDEIDAHPAGGEGGNGIAWESWRYRFMEGIGNDVNMTFRDTEFNGHYPMTKDPNGTR